MAAGATDHTTDDGCLVHHASKLRKDFANLDAWDIRFDGLELPANLTRSLRLDVPHVLVWWTTR